MTVALVLALLVSTAVRAQELTGQEPKPIVTVAFSGYGDLISDLNFVGNLAGNPQLGAALDMMAMMGTGGHEFKSLDRSKPWGALVFADGPEIRVLGFVPMANLEELKTILEAYAAEVEQADGVLTASINDQDVSLKSEGGWVFLSNQADVLGNLPKDPASALRGLEKSYNLAVRLDVQNLPQMLREMLMDGLQLGLQAGMEQRSGESDEAYALRAKMARQSVEEFRKAINELDAIQLGLAIDEKVPSVYLDIEVTAQAGTETARQIMAPNDVKTGFGGFVVPDAAVSYNGVGRLESFHAEQINTMIDDFRTQVHNGLEGQGLTEDEQTTARQLVDDAFALVTSAAKEREVDLGMLFLTGDGRATLLGGIRVADGSKVEDLLKAVVDEAAKDMPELKEAVKFNAAEHAGVRLHTLSIPTDAMGVPQLVELFGEELVLVVGAADKAAYLSVGTDSLEMLKKAIDDSKVAKDLPPAKVTISAAPIARLVAQYAPRPETRAAASMIVDKLADSKGKDRLTITTTIPENGQKVRVEIEEDLLKVLGVLPAIVMGAMPMGR
jgi:hypothetical protein